MACCDCAKVSVLQDVIDHSVGGILPAFCGDLRNQPLRLHHQQPAIAIEQRATERRPFMQTVEYAQLRCCVSPQHETPPRLPQVLRCAQRSAEALGRMPPFVARDLRNAGAHAAARLDAVDLRPAIGAVGLACIRSARQRASGSASPALCAISMRRGCRSIMATIFALSSTDAKVATAAPKDCATAAAVAALSPVNCASAGVIIAQSH
jgi:hypothetical protein